MNKETKNICYMPLSKHVLKENFDTSILIVGAFPLRKRAWKTIKKMLRSVFPRIRPCEISCYSRMQLLLDDASLELN